MIMVDLPNSKSALFILGIGVTIEIVLSFILEYLNFDLKPEPKILISIFFTLLIISFKPVSDFLDNENRKEEDYKEQRGTYAVLKYWLLHLKSGFSKQDREHAIDMIESTLSNKNYLVSDEFIKTWLKFKYDMHGSNGTKYHRIMYTEVEEKMNKIRK